MHYSQAIKDIEDEFKKAIKEFDPFHNEHEGYAVLKEEVDELWDSIKRNKLTTKEERMKEAIQVGAMALRMLHDLY